ncbi:MAG: class I SAM-dependent methyltransferase [Actinobacteria bacterium]|nr:class I SAM-dependent methyltransferase [Actinomycetota bacterium]
MKEQEPFYDNNESPFDLFAEKYDNWFEHEGKLIFDIEVEAFREVLPSLPKPWIEIGVGTGRFADALGIDTGIEPSESMKYIAEKQGIHVIKGRGEERLVPGGSFGSAFIIVTLCFVDNPGMVLNRTFEMLEDSGKLVLGLIPGESPWACYYSRKKKEGHPFYSLSRFYGYGQVLDFLKESGFAHERTLSTLVQGPGRVSGMEFPREGFFPDAGFVVIVAGHG